MGGRKNKFRAREATGGDGRRRRERNMAYLDQGRLQGWSTFERTCGHTHGHTHTKAEYPRAPSGRGRAASTTGRTTQPEILPRTMVYLFFSPPG